MGPTASVLIGREPTEVDRRIVQDFTKSLEDAFGLTPKASLLVSAGMNRAADHRVLGEIVMQLALALHGVIDFDGALLPMASPARAEPGDWSEVAGIVRDLLSTVPGGVIAIEYEVNDSRVWASHVGDCEFMRGWLLETPTSPNDACTKMRAASPTAGPGAGRSGPAFLPSFSVNVEHHPGAVPLCDLQAGPFEQTQPTAIDRQTGPVDRNSSGVEHATDLVATHHHRQCVFRRGAHEPERRPPALQRVREEESDPAQRDRRGGAGDLLLVGEKEEILPQLLFRDPVRAPMVVLGELTHSRDVAALRPCGEAPQLLSSSIRCRRRVMTISFPKRC